MAAEAMLEYRAVLGIQPDHAIAHRNMGIMFMQMGLLREAEAWLNAALRTAPNDEVTLAKLATLKQRKNEEGPSALY